MNHCQRPFLLAAIRRARTSASPAVPLIIATSVVVSRRPLLRCLRRMETHKNRIANNGRGTDNDASCRLLMPHSAFLHSRGRYPIAGESEFKRYRLIVFRPFSEERDPLFPFEEEDSLLTKILLGKVESESVSPSLALSLPLSRKCEGRGTIVLPLPLAIEAVADVRADTEFGSGLAVSSLPAELRRD